MDCIENQIEDKDKKLVDYIWLCQLPFIITEVEWCICIPQLLHFHKIRIQQNICVQSTEGLIVVSPLVHPSLKNFWGSKFLPAGDVLSATHSLNEIIVGPTSNTNLDRRWRPKACRRRLLLVLSSVKCQLPLPFHMAECTLELRICRRSRTVHISRWRWCIGRQCRRSGWCRSRWCRLWCRSRWC